MKTIGIIGGMSWHSTELYYRLINQGVQQKLGGLHSARILMASVEFAEIAELQRLGNWDTAGEILADYALKLQQSGADFIVVATNTMHISVPIIEQQISIPILHIADATANAIIKDGFSKVGLLGTRFTMQMDYFKSRLIQKGLEVIVPIEQDMAMVDRVIFDELCYGNIEDKSRYNYICTINDLKNKGAECIIEGCTEIALLVQPEHTSMPLFDTTTIHAQAIVELALLER